MFLPKIFLYHNAPKFTYACFMFIFSSCTSNIFRVPTFRFRYIRHGRIRFSFTFIFFIFLYFFFFIFLSRHFWRMTLLRFMFFYMHLFYQSNIIHKLTMGRILDYKIFGWTTTTPRGNTHRHYRRHCNARQCRHRWRPHSRWSRQTNPDCRHCNANGAK